MFQTALYMRASLYHVFIDDWLNVLPRHQVMVIRAEDYFDDKRSTLEEVFKFLGLGKYFNGILIYYYTRISYDHRKYTTIIIATHGPTH